MEFVVQTDKKALSPTERPIKHVVLVEDHVQTREAFTRALVQLGFVVYARESVEQAIAREGEYIRLDLAVLDVRLPGQRGDEYAAILRKQHPRLPIVLITADRDIERMRRTAPDVEILTKPVNVAALLDSFIY